MSSHLKYGCFFLKRTKKTKKTRRVLSFERFLFRASEKREREKERLRETGRERDWEREKQRERENARSLSLSQSLFLSAYAKKEREDATERKKEREREREKRLPELAYFFLSLSLSLSLFPPLGDQGRANNWIFHANFFSGWILLLLFGNDKRKGEKRQWERQLNPHSLIFHFYVIFQKGFIKKSLSSYESHSTFSTIYIYMSKLN